MRDVPAETPADTAERCRAVAGRADQDVTDVESGSRCPEAARWPRWRYRCVSRSCFVRSGVIRPGRGRHREMAGAAHPESPGPPAGQPSTPLAHPGRLHLQNRRRTGGVDGRKIGYRNEPVKEKNDKIAIFSFSIRRLWIFEAYFDTPLTPSPRPSPPAGRGGLLRGASVGVKPPPLEGGGWGRSRRTPVMRLEEAPGAGQLPGAYDTSSHIRSGRFGCRNSFR